MVEEVKSKQQRGQSRIVKTVRGNKEEEQRGQEEEEGRAGSKVGLMLGGEK